MGNAAMPIAIFALKNRSLSPVVELFVQEAKQVANEIAGAFSGTKSGLGRRRLRSNLANKPADARAAAETTVCFGD